MLYDDNTDWSETWVEISTGVTLGTAIQNPTKCYTTSINKGLAPSWDPNYYMNLWNTGITDGVDIDAAVVKTVYDPSPVGYAVPSYGAWETIMNLIASDAIPQANIHPENSPEAFNYEGFTYNGVAFDAQYNFWGYNHVYGTGCIYWSASPSSTRSRWNAGFHWGFISQKLLPDVNTDPLVCCLVIRPVKEKKLKAKGEDLIQWD